MSITSVTIVHVKRVCVCVCVCLCVCVCVCVCLSVCLHACARMCLLVELQQQRLSDFEADKLSLACHTFSVLDAVPVRKCAFASGCTNVGLSRPSQSFIYNRCVGHCMNMFDELRCVCVYLFEIQQTYLHTKTKIIQWTQNSRPKGKQTCCLAL